MSKGKIGPVTLDPDRLYPLACGRTRRRALADVPLDRSASQLGEAQRAAQWAAETASALGLPTSVLERLKTAVAEALLAAVLGGSGYPLRLGISVPANLPGVSTPAPRSWGFFLIERLVEGHDPHHLIEAVIYPEGHSQGEIGGLPGAP